MNFGFLAFTFLVSIVFFSFGAFAEPAVVGFPARVVFNEAPVEVSFKVFNQSAFSGRLAIDFFAPVEITVSAPLKIDAGKDANVRVVLAPKKELSGQSYEGMLVVKLGKEETNRPVSLVFNHAEAKPTAPVDSNSVADSNAFGKAFNGFVSFFSTGLNEAVLDVFLLIVALVLAVALFSRISKRF